MILAKGWMQWDADVAPCLVPECGQKCVYFHAVPGGGGYCSWHASKLGALVLVGEETGPQPPTATAESRDARLVRLEILAGIAPAVLEAVEAATSDEVRAALTSLGIRVQNAVLGRK